MALLRRVSPVLNLGGTDGDESSGSRGCARDAASLIFNLLATG